MRPFAIACALLASVMSPITATRAAPPADGRVDLQMPPRRAARAVIDRFGARGSVFNAWIESENETTHVRLAGTPTVDHIELDHCASCKPLRATLSFVSGNEEAQVIHGVFAELRLDGGGMDADDVADPGESGHLALHGCGRP
jgi:hypothetical protein